MGLFTSGSSFASIVQTLVGLIDSLVGLLAALALVVFFIGLVRYVRDSADAKGHAEGRERIIWSLIALFILFSIWGILSVLNVAFFGSNLNTSGSSGTAGQPLNILPSSANSNTAPTFDTNFGGTAQPAPTPTGRLQFTPQQ